MKKKEMSENEMKIIMKKINKRKAQSRAVKITVHVLLMYCLTALAGLMYYFWVIENDMNDLRWNDNHLRVSD